MTSYPPAASASLASTHHRLSHGGPQSISRLLSQHRHPAPAFPTQGLHGAAERRTGSSWLPQRGIRVDFSQGMFPPGGPWATCQAAYMHHQGGWQTKVSTGLLPVMTLHLCSYTLFFFILFLGHKLGDVSMQQELKPMIIIFLR